MVFKLIRRIMKKSRNEERGNYIYGNAEITKISTGTYDQGDRRV